MKTSPIALALVLVGALAAPAFAESLAVGTTNTNDFDGDYILSQLQKDGVNVVAVNEGSDNIVRATVRQADGSQIFQYFYEDTLQPVKPIADTRVLSKLDVKQAQKPSSVIFMPNKSLLDDGDGSN